MLERLFFLRYQTNSSAHPSHSFKEKKKNINNDNEVDYSI